MSTVSANPCRIVGALAQFEYDAMRRVNKKFAALQRIAQLLEQVGDLGNLIPDISSLIPISSITLESYTRLQQNCYFLNLPPASNANLNELRQRVLTAYAALVSKLLNHPHLRMDKLQAALARFQSSINMAAATVADYIQCLQTICDAASQATTVFNSVTKANIEKETKAFTKNFVNNGGQILTDVQKSKTQQVKTTITQIKALYTDTVTDVTVL